MSTDVEIVALVAAHLRSIWIQTGHYEDQGQQYSVHYAVREAVEIVAHAKTAVKEASKTESPVIPAWVPPVPRQTRIQQLQNELAALQEEGE